MKIKINKYYILFVIILSIVCTFDFDYSGYTNIYAINKSADNSVIKMPFRLMSYDFTISEPSFLAPYNNFSISVKYGLEHNSIDWYNILKYSLSTDGYESDYNEKFDRPIDKKIQIDSSFSGLDGSDNKQRWLADNYQNYINETGTFDIKKVSNNDILRFVRNYQINEMYLRYFGWQFIGKEYIKEEYSWNRSDLFGNNQILALQDNSNLANIDWFRYGLPFAFIFGIIGIVYHFIRDPKRALSVLILFLATGIAIVLYLNQHDPQPRERDYSYVGSFFAFSIWIGIGCMAFFDFIKYIFSTFVRKDLNKKIILIPIISLSLIMLMVPLTYLTKDYSVHNRSGNFSARDYGYNILIGCKPDSIIFTNDDNDTFPLWYSQEVENNRTDVRVINLSLLNASWYIKQIYNNNAPGTIKFDFNEPIISEEEYIQIINRAKKLGVVGNLPIFINSEENYYIDINSNKKYDTYNPEETLKIIDNLEDPITSTIYAYKRWDPAAWAYIESSYIYYEIQKAVASPGEFNILNTIYTENYKDIMELVRQEAIKEIGPVPIKDGSDSYLYQQELNQYNQQILEYEFYTHVQFALSMMDTNQDGTIGYNEKQISEYLDEFVQAGHWAFQEDSLELNRWGMTPDNINGVNYPYYYMDIPPFNCQSPMMIQMMQKLFNIPSTFVKLQNFTMYDKAGRAYTPAQGGTPTT